MRHNPARLIVQVNPPVPVRQRKQDQRCRDIVNAALEKITPADGVRVSAVGFTNTGNFVFTVREGHMAKDLAPHTNAFMPQLVGEGQTFHAGTPDQRWFKVQVNGVPTKGTVAAVSDDDAMRVDQVAAVHSGEALKREILREHSKTAKWSWATLPHWMGAPETIASKSKASIVLAFTSEEDMSAALKTQFTIFGCTCYARRYVDISPVHPCGNCQAFDHPDKVCKKASVCAICGENHHTSKHKCAGCVEEGDVRDEECPHDPKCANCGGKHRATELSCPVCRRFKEHLLRPTGPGGGKVASKIPAPAKSKSKSKPKGKGKEKTLEEYAAE